MSGLCVVLGNGPSLKGFDFQRLSGTPTLGMNAAYRFWDKIGWYPDYYACLDDQLILSHHDEIYRLWKDGLIKKFFLHAGFYDFHPDCIGKPEFFSLDQVLPHWYRKRGQGLGWQDLTEHPAFKTQDTTKITTGAFATRFCAYLGHTTLALMGIDLKYVEILPQAEKTEGVGLIMKETPSENPNYFFDGYQRAGDKYNIPNPDVHNNRLHIESFRLIAADYKLTGQNAEIFNTNPNSILEDEKVFELRSIDSLLIPHKLAAIVVPTTQFEIEALLANFDIWSAPEYAPLRAGDIDNRCALVFMFNNELSKQHEADIRAKFSATGMGRYFSHLGFEYLGLEGEYDKYERDYSKKVGEHGFKSGPNNQFFRTMQASRSLGRYVFQMETDCVPLRRGWLSGLRDLAEKAEPFWILGSRYHGVETLSPAFKDHLNGNALYAVGDPGFCNFLDTFWEPRTRQMVKRIDRRLAYDCILEKIFTEQRDSDPEVRNVLETHGDKFRATGHILNISGKRDLAELKPDFCQDLLQRFPDALVLHNRAAQVHTAQALMKAAQDKTAPAYPRLLLFDMTAMGDGTATGEVKASLLGGWPHDRIMQIAREGSGGLSVVRALEDGGYEGIQASPEDAAGAINDFAPEAILYRPVPNVPWLHDFAMDVIKRLPVPLITWLMDDWPSDLAVNDPEQWRALEPDLNHLLDRSSACLSICDAMSDAFAKRYGKTFQAFANGVNPVDWVELRHHENKRLRLRYAGGLAKNMTRESVLRIARAVEALAGDGHEISFEINTQKWWYEQSIDLFREFKRTMVETVIRPMEDYRAWLREADSVVIAYNYDQETLRYVQYSMANKMPECLASGAPLFVHGPADVATVDYLASTGAAEVVTDQSEQKVKEGLLALLSDPARRNALAAEARRIAFLRHNIVKLREGLRESIAAAAKVVPLETRTEVDTGSSLALLDRLVSEYDTGKASLLLNCCAASLLLSAGREIARFNDDSTLQAAIDRARQDLPGSDATKAHFDRVFAFAQSVAETRSASE